MTDLQPVDRTPATRDHELSDTVDPARLIQLMETAGWTRVGSRAGVYVRLAWPVGSHREHQSIIVPLDRTMADYPNLLAAVLLELDDAAYLGQRARTVLDALDGPPVP